MVARLVLIAVLLLTSAPTWLSHFAQVLAASSEGAAQLPASTTKTSAKWIPPQTPWGDPDLQGIWTNCCATPGTPFERPAEYGGREFLTEQELAKLREEDRRRVEDRKADRAPGAGGLSGPQHWIELAIRTNRTSQVVDPPDGKVPPITPEAAKRPKIGSLVRSQYSSWEDLSTWDRCITRGIPGSMLPTQYNNNYQILQVPGYVVILYEMIHDARIIPIDGRPHLPSSVRQWMGDPRGRWEGNTLVVEVTNYTDKTKIHSIRSNVNHSQDLRLIERFTRLNDSTIDYWFTVEDWATFTRPWTANIPLFKEGAPDRILEYACHEGNYAIPNALSGSRAAEKAEAGTKK